MGFFKWFGGGDSDEDTGPNVGDTRWVEYTEEQAHPIIQVETPEKTYQGTHKTFASSHVALEVYEWSGETDTRITSYNMYPVMDLVEEIAIPYPDDGEVTVTTIGEERVTLTAERKECFSRNRFGRAEWEGTNDYRNVEVTVEENIES